MSKNKPKWLKVAQLQDAAADDLKKRQGIKVSLPNKSKRVVATYVCKQCRREYDSKEIEPQIKRAARSAKNFISCPKCASPLVDGKSAIVRQKEAITHNALKLRDTNAAPNHGIHTWVDKAIYGKMVTALGRYIEKMGMFNPQLRFQHGARASKFPGQSNSAKSAEFTCDFIDNNNTRNRIVVEAGITTTGEFIFPKTFKTLQGNEYPLTVQAIKELTRGKLYERVYPDTTIPPLTYRPADPTRFREISADQKKMQKKGQDDLEQHIKQDMGVTNPEDIQKIKEITQKYQGNSNLTAPPVTSQENFMDGVGTTASNKEDQKKSSKQATAKEMALAEAVDQGLGFAEAFNQVLNETGESITLDEYNALGQYITEEADTDPTIIADSISKLVKSAESEVVKKFHKTAEAVYEEFDLSSMTDDEQKVWVNTFLDTHNKSVDNGDGIVEAKSKARFSANDKVAEMRIKMALRDETTLVPYTDPDPDYSLSKQTELSEPRFDKPDNAGLKDYHEMDGGISELKDRNYYNMFGREGEQHFASRKVTSKIRKEDGKWVVYSESGEKLGEHDTKEDAEDQLQAIHIQQHSSVKWNDIKTALQKKAYPDKGIHPALYELLKGAIGANIPFDKVARLVKAATGMELQEEDWEEAQRKFNQEQQQENRVTANISKTAAYQITEAGEAMFNYLQGSQLTDDSEVALYVLLSYLKAVPNITMDALMQAAMQNPQFGPEDTEVMQEVFRRALENNLIDIEQEDVIGEEVPVEGFDEDTIASKNKIQKEGEATGFDLEPDEVGQNPINYSRYVKTIEDLLRAGNIPPTKVDMHKLKDGGYTLKELKKLVDTFKVDKDTYYPTSHANIDKETLKKLAEQKLSDMFKEMPMEQVDENGDELGKGYGEEMPPLTPDQVSKIKEEMSEDVPEPDVLEGGYGDDVPSAFFDAEQLVRGIEVELEHADDHEKAEEIAKDHLMEDPNYYSQLREMEGETPGRDVDELRDVLTQAAFKSLQKKSQFDLDDLGERPSETASNIVDKKGKEIAEGLNLIYNGIQELGPEKGGTFVFTDPITKSTFFADTFEEAEVNLSEMRKRFSSKKKAEEEKKPTLYDQWGNPIESEPEINIEPPSFLTRKAPGVTEEPEEATPEEASLMQELQESKMRVDTLQTQIATVQAKVQQELAPLQQEAGKEAQRQLRATRQLAAIMNRLEHQLIRAGNLVGQYIEKPAPRKLTAAQKVKTLIEAFGEEAEKVLKEAEDNLNQVIEIVGKYKQWPARRSSKKIAENPDEAYVIRLYQETYNMLTDLFNEIQDLNMQLSLAA